MKTARYTLSLPQPLNVRLKDMARSLGLPVATFVRHLIIEEVRKSFLPSFPMSNETEKIVSETDKAYKRGELKKFTSVDEMFKRLDQKVA